MLLRTAKARILTFVALATAAAGLPATALADANDGFVVSDPHYGEALYYFYQQENFAALTELMVSQDFGRLSHHEQEAELLQGGLLLSWGQHREAAMIFERLLADGANQSVRDRTWFYLGKIRYQRGYVDEAQAAFENIAAPLPAELEAERYNLLARVYIDQGSYREAADLLTDWEGPEIWMAYAKFNLGVALVRLEDLDTGAALLEQIGTMKVRDDETLALRDRANLALGFAYLQANRNADAMPVLRRVRLNGPFSNKALLGAGWAATAENDFRRALAPWTELSKRDLLDSAVQESLLAVPYAYAQLDAQPQAAEYYAKALDIFGAEIARLDEAVGAAEEGRLVSALLTEDRVISGGDANSATSQGGWFWQLDALPDDNQARYLYFTIADHRFHETLKSYRDLVFLDEQMASWEGRLSAYQDMLDTRELAYAERLPAMQARMSDAELATMRADYESLQQELQRAKDSRDVVALAPADQQRQWQTLVDLEASPAWDEPATAELRAKQRVLKGLLQWDLEREFRVRAWRQEQALASLADDLAAAEQGYAAVDAAVASIDGTVDGFDVRIRTATLELAAIRARIQRARQQHENLLNGIAVAELRAQQDRLTAYRSQARFALATLYDRLSANRDQLQPVDTPTDEPGREQVVDERLGSEL